MTLPELKQKYGERIVNLVVTDIVAEGMTILRERSQENAERVAQLPEKASSLGDAIRLCLEDINNSSWNDIRSIIKRSL